MPAIERVRRFGQRFEADFAASASLPEGALAEAETAAYTALVVFSYGRPVNHPADYGGSARPACPYGSPPAA